MVPIDLQKLRLREPLRPTTPPRLNRSRSGAENNSINNNNQGAFTNTRSKSTTRSSRNNNKEDYYNINITKTTSSSKTKKVSSSTNHDQDNINSSTRDGFVRFLQRDVTTTPRNSTTVPKRLKSPSSKSPSAWALSPGRSLFKGLGTPEPMSASNGDNQKTKVKGGGGVSAVWKYFRFKKVSPIQEEETHKLRVLHNRLLQWRFANAKAQLSMASLEKASEEKLFNVWFWILSARNLLMERRIHIQKLKHEVKLCQIVNGQMRMLNDWSKIEGKNIEAVSRVVRKLSALSIKIPLADDAKADVESINAALNMAMEVMNSIESTISKFVLTVERTLFLLTEIASTVEHQPEKLQEMENAVRIFLQLATAERSVRVHLMQLANKEQVNIYEQRIQAFSQE